MECLGCWVVCNHESSKANFFSTYLFNFKSHFYVNDARKFYLYVCIYTNVPVTF